MTQREPEVATFGPSGRVPNNTLPVLIYRQTGADSAPAIERLFARHGWTNMWRDGIYPFHHFHTNTHEVLGIASGWVQVRLGGETGRDFTLETGDIAVLPAGVGHRRLVASPHLLVVGGYPDGQEWDLIRGDELDDNAYQSALTRIAAVDLPTTDPVHGTTGPLLRLWRGR